MYSLLKRSKNMDFRRIPRPIRKLFEIQGNESKNCLKHRFFQYLIAAPTHAMLLFGVREEHA